MLKYNDKMEIMNILICDDLQVDAIKLENAVKEASRQISQQNSAHFEVNVTCFLKAQDVLKYIKTGANIDVCFLDIIMPEMNGIELAGKMRAAGFNGKIVFLTTSKDYGVESYQVKAYFYLLKPANTQDVAKLLNEIKNDAQIEDTAGIKIETRNITKFVHFYEISFVEVINKNVYIRLLDGSEIVIFTSLGDILPQLMTDERFAQCHRSYVVNMDAITQIHGREISLRCGRKVHISKSYKGFNDLYFKRGMGSDI